MKKEYIKKQILLALFAIVSFCVTPISAHADEEFNYNDYMTTNDDGGENATARETMEPAPRERNSMRNTNYPPAQTKQEKRASRRKRNKRKNDPTMYDTMYDTMGDQTMRIMPIEEGYQEAGQEENLRPEEPTEHVPLQEM